MNVSFICLVEKLGSADAESFVLMIKRSSFNYIL